MIDVLKEFYKSISIIDLIYLIITIVSLIYKFKNKDLKNIENVELFPSLENGTVINSFEIKGNLLYLNIREDNGTNLIKIYNLKNGEYVSTIKLSD